MVKAIQYILGVILLLLVIIMTVYYHHFSTLTEEEKSMKHSILQYNNKINPHISNSNITTTNDLITLQAYINQQDNEIIALKTQLQQLKQQQPENNNNINKNLLVPTESSTSSYIVPHQYSLEAPPSTLQQVLFLILSLYNTIPMSYTHTHYPPLYKIALIILYTHLHFTTTGV